MTQTGDRASTARDRHSALGLNAEDLIEMYHFMRLTRTLDERIWQLNRQGKAPIVASCQGHEAAQVASALCAQRESPDHFFFPYYRDLGVKLVAGTTPEQVLCSFLAKVGDVWSGARQFGLQGANRARKCIQSSNVVAAGMTHGVGYAYACRQLKDPAVVFIYIGDGGMSEGESHEAMNFAGVYKLPVLFLVENNKYAISVPMSKQMAIKDIAVRAQGYGFPGVVVDGMDVLESYGVVREAVRRAAGGGGPTLLEFKLERLMPHTSDDDDTRYRSREEIAALRRQKDPLLAFSEYLKERGLLSDAQEQEIVARCKDNVDRATDAALAAPYPEATDANFFNHLYGA